MEKGRRSLEVVQMYIPRRLKNAHKLVIAILQVKKPIPQGTTVWRFGKYNRSHELSVEVRDKVPSYVAINYDAGT